LKGVERKSGSGTAENNLSLVFRATKWALVLWMFFTTISTGLSARAQSPEAAASAAQEAPSQPQPGSISGTVVDRDGAVIAIATVTLEQSTGAPASTSSTGPPENAASENAPHSKREAHSDGEGHFVFAGVPPGPFQLTFAAPGFATQEKSGVLHSGEDYVIPQIELAAHATVDVEVTLPLDLIAADQVKVEEQQRLLGIVPNYYVSYVRDAAPLTTKLKFQLAWKTTVDPISIVIVGGVAGIQQAENAFSGYGQGAQGYAKRFGAAYADLVSGTFIGSAILPSLLKQDPRYFYKGTGSTKSRFFYAVANSVICKGDNRRWQPNYSFIIGDLAAGGISNLYYPAQNRNGAALTFENALIAIGGGAVGNVIQEFFLRKLTPHVPDKASTGP
jgi:Carboxypeptidase regulatory-like domain